MAFLGRPGADEAIRIGQRLSTELSFNHRRLKRCVRGQVCASFVCSRIRENSAPKLTAALRLLTKSATLNDPPLQSIHILCYRSARRAGENRQERRTIATDMNQALHQFILWSCLAAAASGCRGASTAETPPDTSAAEEEAPFDPSAVKMPADYQEALVRIGSYHDQIRDAIASNDLEKAHHPLDEADLVLNRLPEIARESGVPRRDWEQVVTAAEDLNERFGELHAAIDAGQAPDYAALKQPIDDALARLGKVSAQASLPHPQAKK